MIADDVDILLVEDDEADAELIVRALRKHNIANRIIRVNDGAEALDLLFREGGYADRGNSAAKVVLLDIKLPRVDGIEVLRRMKSDERTREIPVVMLTSSNQERDIKAAYELGVNSYVTKPIQFAEFAKVVSELGIYWLMLNKAPSD